MIDIGILITGGVGIITTAASSWISYFLTRKKYNTEVDSNEIKNLKDSLKFYEEIVKDNNEKLQFYIDLSKKNNIEVYRLKSIVHRLLNNSCLDGTCGKRQFYTEEQIRNILGETISPFQEEENETKA